MSDTSLPVLLGLTLPSVMDVSAGSHAVPVLARARDPGGEGVRQVIVYFDKPLGQTVHHWSGFGDSFAIGGLMSQDTFSDATPDTADGVLSLTKMTRSGSYTVTKVAVEDLAGNRSVYSTAQLQAMGVQTTMQVRGGVDDTTAPSLLKLALPASVNLGAGPAALELTGEVKDNAGGAGVTFATVWFDRPLAFSDGLRASFALGTPISSSRDGVPVPLSSSASLSTATASGTYQVTKVTVTDLAGNTTTYTPEQLKALGVNTALKVSGGAGPGASMDVADAGEGFDLAVAAPAWSASGRDSFKLVLHYDPTVFDYTGAALPAGAVGQISSGVTTNGMAGVVTITGSASMPAGSSIHIGLLPVKENRSSPVEVAEFTVNGSAQLFADGKTSWIVQGSDDDDLILAGNNRLIDGGGGDDTVHFSAGRDGFSIDRVSGAIEVSQPGGATRTVLRDVERIAFNEDYVAFDPEGLEAGAYRLFRAALDRIPDKAGLGYWISQLEHGMSQRDMARGLFESAEFSELAGSGSSTVYVVSTLYRNVFDREPDEAGLLYWTRAVDSGIAYADLLLAFSDSAEFRARLVAEIENGIEYTLW